jgi:hypothetical protein
MSVSNDPAGKMALTMPRRSASSALSLSLKKYSSRALPLPTRRVRNHVPP